MSFSLSLSFFPFYTTPTMSSFQVASHNASFDVSFLLRCITHARAAAHANIAAAIFLHGTVVKSRRERGSSARPSIITASRTQRWEREIHSDGAMKIYANFLRVARR